jgi:catechol 2,3-dioxygenase-like lactoylglutathione lyase family enzyme
MIIGIHHATFLTRDLIKAREFYEGVLGLQIDTNRPHMTFEGVWYVISANQQIHLMLLPNPESGLIRPDHGGRDRHVALTVTDITKLIARFENAKVPYMQSKSGRRAVFCRDPEGNALEFIEIDL